MKSKLLTVICLIMQACSVGHLSLMERFEPGGRVFVAPY